MMTKPPGFASSSTLPLDDEEESIDESLDEILLEANERPPENSVKSLEAVPSALSDEDSDAELGAVARPARSRCSRRVRHSSTRCAKRRQRSTPTRPRFAPPRRATTASPARRASSATARCASRRRSRGCRRRARTTTTTSSSRMPTPPTTRRSTARRCRATSASARPPTFRSPTDASPPSGYLAGSGSAGFSPRLPPPLRTAPPPGRPDIYPGRRIPTPSTTSNTNDFLPIPTGGFGSGSHYPSIAIPAPIAPDTSSARVAALTDSRIRLPAAGLAGFLVTAFGGGLLIGALLWRGHAAPRADPAAAGRGAHRAGDDHRAGAADREAGAAARARGQAGPATGGDRGGRPGARACRPWPPRRRPRRRWPSRRPRPSRPRRRRRPPPRSRSKFSMADEDAILNGEDPTPPPPPAPRAKKKKAAWTDPFAQ